MKWLLVGLFFLFLLRIAMGATTNVTIQGGPVVIKGGYVDLGQTVLVSTTPATSDKAGQCVGILCGVTYN